MSERRLLHWELLELHCPRKFLADVAEQVSPGCHLEMGTQDSIDPCRVGCQPAIRRFVHEHRCSAEYVSPEHTFQFRYEGGEASKASDTDEKACDHEGWDKLPPNEFQQAKEHYSNRLADAFEKVACERLLQDDPTIEPLLAKSGLMAHVSDFPMPASAVVFPRKDQEGRIVYGYTWDRIESMSTEELGLELFEQVQADRATGKIG